MVSVNRGLSRPNLQTQHTTTNRIMTVLQYPVRHGIQVAQVESNIFSLRIVIDRKEERGADAPAGAGRGVAVNDGRLVICS